MSLRAFRQAGHGPTLLSAFLYFDVSFMVWVLLGPLGTFIGETYHLTATQKGFLTAVPLLGGSFFRPILGLVDGTIRRSPHRLSCPSPYLIAADARLARRRQLQRIPRRRLAPRDRGRQLRGRLASGKRVVSARTSGTRDGHRRSRQ